MKGPKMKKNRQRDDDILLRLKSRKILGFSILFAISVFFIYYVISHAKDFMSLSIVSIPSIAAAFAIYLLLIFTSGLITRFLLEAFGIRLPFKDYFGLSAISSFYNMITPFGGGSIARAAYLKRRYKFSYMNFIAMLSTTQMMNIIIASFLGLASLTAIYFLSGVFNKTIFFIFLALFLLMAAAMIVFPMIGRFFKEGFLSDKSARLLKGWETIRKRPRIMVIVLMMVFAQFLIGIVDIKVSYNIFGVKVGFINSVFLYSVGLLSALAAFTPGALGISELIQVFSALVVGINPPQAIAAALAGRVVSFFVLSILGLLFSYMLFKKLPHKAKNSNMKI